MVVKALHTDITCLAVHSTQRSVELTSMAKFKRLEGGIISLRSSYLWVEDRQAADHIEIVLHLSFCEL